MTPKSNFRLLLISLLFLLQAFTSANVLAQTQEENEFRILLDSMAKLQSNEQTAEAIALGESILNRNDLSDLPEQKMEVLYALAKSHSLSFGMDKATVLANQIIQIANSIKDYQWAVKANDMIGLGYFEYSEYDSTKAYLYQSMLAAKSHGLKSYPRTLVNMAWINGLMDNEEEEISYYIESLKVVEGSPELDARGGIRSMAYGGLGDYYTRNGDYEKAGENFERKRLLAEETSNINARFEAYLGLGTLYSREDYFDLKKAEDAYLQLTTDTVNASAFVHGLGYLGLGRLYVTAEDYNKGLKAFEDAYAIFRTFQSNDYQSRIETDIANIHFQRNNYHLANTWIEKALDNARAKNLSNRERNALKIRYKLDSALSDYKAAFNNYQRFRVIDDSLKTEESKQRIEELEVKYETEQTENQNLLLKNDLALKEADLRQKAIIQTVFAVVAGLLAILAYVIFRGDRRKKGLNLALEQKNELISRQKEELQFKTDKLQIINSQLKALFDFRKDLTRMIAHDMKNPLNSIIGLSSTLEKDGKVNNITKSGYQLLDLVTNMLEVERLEEMKIEPKKVEIALDELVKEAREQVELLVAAKSIIFQNLLPKKLTIHADKQLMVRVFINLLTNAIKYSNSGDTIKIYHQHEGERVLITVEDNGIGISSERLPYIFDKFWQGEQRKSGLATSNGLGLTYCRLAVEAHGGTIGVESQPGEGTRITFSLLYSGEKLSSLKEVKPSKVDLIIEEELENLQSYWPELAELQVYEVSKVKDILKRMEDENLKSLWLGELLKAVYQGDTTYFHELIQAVRPLATI